MSRHRAGPAHKHRATQPVTKHRAEVRPRYGRIATLASSLVVTVIAVVGGAGLLPLSGDDANPAAAIDRAGGQETTPEADPSPASHKPPRASDPDREPVSKVETKEVRDTALPSGSGEGKRVVFSESRQRVWLVDQASRVVRTYLVSGSLYDNLDPGAFSVYSRSEDAVGVDDSGTMKYFVRFTTGDEGAAIGFHDIPVDQGQPVQRVADLGTPLSHGCIRQHRSDAIALWDFAPVGTTVVVTA